MKGVKAPCTLLWLTLRYGHLSKRHSMAQVSNSAHTLDQLDAMFIESAQAISFDERDALLDQIIADDRHEAMGSVSHRTVMYTDYFDEDLTRILKVKAVKVDVRGTTSANFDGEVVGYNPMEQYRACFRNIETKLTAGRTNFNRVVNMVVFLTNMDNWEKFNEVFWEFVPNPPCRAVIGTTGLARPSIVIEIADCFAYRASE